MELLTSSLPYAIAVGLAIMLLAAWEQRREALAANAQLLALNKEYELGAAEQDANLGNLCASYQTSTEEFQKRINDAQKQIDDLKNEIEVLRDLKAEREQRDEELLETKRLLNLHQVANKILVEQRSTVLSTR